MLNSGWCLMPVILWRGPSPIVNLKNGFWVGSHRTPSREIKLPILRQRLPSDPEFPILLSIYSVFGIFLHSLLCSFGSIYEFRTDYSLLNFPAALEVSSVPVFLQPGC